jgi:hypothetical protein
MLSGVSGGYWANEAFIRSSSSFFWSQTLKSCMLFTLDFPLHSRAKCPSLPQLKHAPFFLRGVSSLVAALAVFLLVHRPWFGALERADMSIGTATLFQVLGAVEELYGGRGGCGALPTLFLWKKGQFCGGR